MTIQNRSIDSELGPIEISVYVCEYSGEITPCSDIGERWVHVETLKKSGRTLEAINGDFCSIEHAAQYTLDMVTGTSTYNVATMKTKALQDGKVTILSAGILTIPV